MKVLINMIVSKQFNIYTKPLANKKIKTKGFLDDHIDETINLKP